jgi:hypothetical protein
VSIPLADGPAMYFGGTIMTFALPMGAFIVASVTLFYLYRAPHSGPKLKYLVGGAFSSFGTREPGPASAPPVAAAEEAPKETVAEEAPEQPAESETPDQASDPEPESEK